MLVPLNAAPGPAHAVLPVGNAVQVTGEEGHMGTLRAWTRPQGEGWVHVTLHRVTEQLARSTRTVVEVRLDGEPVGQLTPKMSGEYSPVIELLDESGVLTAARAVVKGNALKADVVLYAAKAGQLGDDWIRAAVGAAPAAARPAPREQAAASAPVAQPSPSDRGGRSEPAAPAAPQLPPAGWFPDPAGRAALRWWDGRNWTEHQAPAQNVTQAAAPANAAVVGAPAASAGYESLPAQSEIEGYGITVIYDHQTLRVRGTNGLARLALAGAEHGQGDVVIPRDAIVSAKLQGANPLVNGNLVITTSEGRTYQLHFRRKQQTDFERLTHELGI